MAGQLSRDMYKQDIAIEIYQGDQDSLAQEMTTKQRENQYIAVNESILDLVYPE